MQKLFFPCLLTLSLFASSIHLAKAGNFDISNSSTSSQSLSSGQTGQVESSGSLTTSGSTVDVTVTGSATLTNNGTIKQTGSGRAVVDSGSGITLTLNNNAGALMQTADADVIQMGDKKGNNVTLNNYGTMNSLNASDGGAQAVDFNGITTGSNTVNNFTGGVLEATDADAVRPGANGFVYNDGTIKSTEIKDLTSDGIDAQTNSGITIVNAASLKGETIGASLIEGARHGITGGNTTGTGAYTMSITNNAGGTIKGNDGSGVNIDGINGNELVTLVNHGTITGNGVNGDGDGVDVDGLVNLTNTGTIKSLNAKADTSEGVTVGGGTITNSGLIEGDVASGNTTGATGVGITLAGIDSTTPISGIYGNTTVTNSGTIRGQTGAAIQATGAANSFTIAINNQAGGMIEGGGTGAAIQLGGNNDTVTNSGTIKADSSNKAVDLGGGTNKFEVDGGSASVQGNISGGTGSVNSSMVVAAGTGNSFSYSGAISNFGTVEAQSGTFSLSGSINGATTTVDNHATLHLAQGTAGAVNLASGGTLSGNGTVGALNIGTGSTLSPGDSPGRISAGNTILNPTGNFLFQVDTDGSTGSAGSSWDQLAVTGTLNLSALSPSGQFVFALQSLDGSDAAGSLADFDPSIDHVWTDVITTTAGFIGTFNPSDFSVDASLFGNTVDGTFSVVQDTLNSHNLDLEYTAAPEPKTWALLLGGATLFFGFARSRKHLA